MFIYNWVVFLYGIVIRLASYNQQKAKYWVSGRKNWRNNLLQKIAHLNKASIIWIHCASYGEFEQGKPLIESIKKKYPHYKIVLSFFSPSGYEVFKNWSGADVICYLPLDTRKNARDFIKIINPRVVIFIKYEFWLNFLQVLKTEKIPTYLVSAVFKPHHPFFKWYGYVFKNSLTTFKKLFIQDEASGKLLEKIGIQNYQVTGDTRFDRVIEVKDTFTDLPSIKEFCGSSKIIVAGSTWHRDDELIIAAFKLIDLPDLKLIIVPHNVDEKNIQKLIGLLQKNRLSFNLFSKQQAFNNEKILIVDTIGLLSRIYYYASIAYVGGGLNEGIHNCLEPAVYLKPTLFYGNDYHKYNEAVDLIAMGAAKNILSTKSLEAEVRFYLSNPTKILEIEKQLVHYFKTKSGTTTKILEILNLTE